MTGETTRIALAVEYNGQPYCGWQRQPHCHTVQAEVEQALSKVAQEPIVVQCSGRTDTGVHALAQIIHFDTQVIRPLKAWTFGANTHMARSVSIHWAAVAHPEFHARFKATERRYRYTIFNRASRTGLYADHTTWVNKPLDAEAMNAATAALVGEHDFSAFRSSDCQANHAVRTIREFSVTRDGERLYIDIVANGFLHNMVRILSGCLIKIGKHEKPVEWLAELLQMGDRRLAGMTAPPQGLCFIQANYPPEYEIPDFRPSKPAK